SGDPRRGLCDTYPRQVCVIDLNVLPEESRRKRGIVQIEIDSFRITKPMCFILNLLLQAYDHGAAVGRGRVLDPGYLRKNRQFFADGRGQFRSEERRVG